MTDTTPFDTDEPAIRLERVYPAPVQTVWAMWADPERFATWYGPVGASVPTITYDFRPGGRRHLCMEVTSPDGTMQMWFVGEFVTIDEPTTLVYTESMSNEAGEQVSPATMGMPGDHPLVTEVRVELAEVADGTRLTLIHRGVPAGSPGEAGWTMALGKLDEELADTST